jgi:hypothetical protein
MTFSKQRTVRRVFALLSASVVLGAALIACSSSTGGASGGAGGASGTAGVAGSTTTGGASGAGAQSGTSGVPGTAGGNSAAGQNSADTAGASDLGAGGAPDCVAGDLGCDGLTPVSCQNGQLRRSAPDCAFTCKAGACAGQCAVGSTRCDGKVFETCGASSLWESGTSCNFVCDDMQGCIGDCMPGALKCGSATELDTCSPQGAFTKSADCDLKCDVVSGAAECVECTSGDGQCPGGCTNPEDSDCAADPTSICPNIYLGLGRYKTPQPKDFANTSISTLLTMKVGITEVVEVAIYNHGHNASPAVTLEILWGDPTDGCSKNLHSLGDGVGFAAVPAASLSPALDGTVSTNYGFTPDATALATNGGHICLLARIYETVAPSGAGCVQQSNNSVSPATDPLSAVLDVQIIPAN